MDTKQLLKVVAKRSMLGHLNQKHVFGREGRDDNWFQNKGLNKVRDCFRNRLTPGSYGQCPNPAHLIYWLLGKATVAKLELEPCSTQQ